MKSALNLGLVIVLLWSSFAFAQVPSSTEKKSEPPAALDPRLGLGARVPVSPTARFGDIEITSDTQGVDFGPYLQQVLQNIKRNWYAIIPYSAMPPVLKKGKLSIEFAITKDGQFTGLRYVTSSGDVALDRAAYGGITASNPFPPLPSDFSGQYLRLRMSFLYNPWLKGISPSGAQVRAGSSLQFSTRVAPTDITDAMQFHVTWSVAGRGCAEAACGTISENGLYTAPPTVPQDPSVTVKATADGDLGETASTVVTIVPADTLPKPSR